MAPKIISLLAFLLYAALAIFITVFGSLGEPLKFEDLGNWTFWVGNGVLWVGPGVNLGYYFFLRKRSKENKIPRHATAIALLLALGSLFLLDLLPVIFLLLVIP